MIKILHIRPAGDEQLDLTFSDGATACWSAADLIARKTELTVPLADSAYFARVFKEAGALAWPNGFELSPSALHRELERTGALNRAVV